MLKFEPQKFLFGLLPWVLCKPNILGWSYHNMNFLLPSLPFTSLLLSPPLPFPFLPPPSSLYPLSSLPSPPPCIHLSTVTPPLGGMNGHPCWQNPWRDKKKGKVLQKTRTSLPFMIQPAISFIPRTQYGNEACIHNNNMFAYKR